MYLSQEIGRAGRDGRLSYCHLFYDEDTYLKLRSLSHRWFVWVLTIICPGFALKGFSITYLLFSRFLFSDGVDEYAVGKFLTHVFSSDTKQHEKICSIVIESASHKFDMKEEVFFLNLMTFLEPIVLYLLIIKCLLLWECGQENSFFIINSLTPHWGSGRLCKRFWHI